MKNKNAKSPVLQDWVLNLSWKAQTCLISAIRGLDTSDGLSDEIISDAKKITKMIRFAVLNNADKSTGFMTSDADDVTSTRLIINSLANGVVSDHWHDHIYKALDIISKNHPHGYIAGYWNEVLKCTGNKEVKKPINKDKSFTKEFIASISLIEDYTNSMKATTDNSGYMGIHKDDTIYSLLTYMNGKTFSPSCITPSLTSLTRFHDNTFNSYPDQLNQMKIAFSELNQNSVKTMKATYIAALNSFKQNRDKFNIYIKFIIDYTNLNPRAVDYINAILVSLNYNPLIMQEAIDFYLFNYKNSIFLAIGDTVIYLKEPVDFIENPNDGLIGQPVQGAGRGSMNDLIATISQISLFCHMIYKPK